jgi:hypothetical protein
VIETYFAKKEGKPLPVLQPKDGAPVSPEEDPDSPAVFDSIEVADSRSGDTVTLASR